MPRIGSDGGFVSSNIGGLFDDQGNAIVSSDTDFGASPLGIAARNQALYALPNPSFNLTPPDPASPIVDNDNPMPYWSVEDLSEGRMNVTTIFDSATQTWAAQINPTAGSASDSITLTTRSYLLNDTNFNLRQKALASLTKVGTYSSTSQFTVSLTATYYDSTGTSLSSYTVGSVADNTTWTSISGFTTSGTAIVSAAAQYLDLAFTLTATAAVTSGVKVNINSLLLQTSVSGGAGGGLLVTETFTSSTTWTRPTGVDYLVAAIGLSGGGGGEGGTASTVTAGFSGNQNYGGHPGVYALLRDIYIGDQSTISIGVGAGGNGGIGGTAVRGGSTTAPVAPGDGGATTFGTYLTCTTASVGTAAGTASGVVTTTTPFASTVVTTLAETQTATTIRANSYWQTNGFSVLPYQSSYPLAGQDGEPGVASAGTTGTAGGTSVISGQTGQNAGGRTLGGAGGSAGYIAGRGGRSSIVRIDNSGGYAYAGTTLASGTATIYYAGSAQAGAGGGGGAAVFGTRAVSTNIYVKGGNGGSAAANSGSGGGAGGPASIGGTAYPAGSSGTAIGGNGGNGGNGFVIIAYVA